MPIDTPDSSGPRMGAPGATSSPGAFRLAILSSEDVITARKLGRTLASRLRLTTTELTMVATAISEIARNILEHARTGELFLTLVQDGGRRGVLVKASDRGPGIADLARALKGGESTGEGLGAGLSGSKRLMDEFAVVSQPGVGTTVTMTKWEPLP